MKNCNMILTKKLRKYQLFHKVKLANMNILQAKKYYLLMTEEAMFTLGKVFVRKSF